MWNDDRAVGISVPIRSLADRHVDSIQDFFEVRLKSTNPTPILGEKTIEGDKLLFKPLIAFSKGLTYEIIFRDRKIADIKIPFADAVDPPSLVEIYPTRDTLPENLLKIYLEFSHPMREGESQKHLEILDNQNDTIPGVFLNLQPELWNEERTVLTIWLDPGRIKRELIPNQQLGNPLQNGKSYTLVISSDWKDVNGVSLPQTHKRQFIVGSRDSVLPDPDRWSLNLPRAGTIQPFVINTNESLDYFLLQETIHIIDKNGAGIPGTMKISDKESKLTFIPSRPWEAGQHTLQVESYLEDLAGNNLNKSFDRDITIEQSKPDKRNYERHFVIIP